jgi:hypothetical protein
MFEVAVFWDVTPCIDVVGYQSYGESYCLHVQGEYGGTKASFHIIMGCHNPEEYHVNRHYRENFKFRIKLSGHTYV